MKDIERIAYSPAEGGINSERGAGLYVLCSMVMVVLMVMLLSGGCVSTSEVTPFYRYETRRKILDSPPYLQILLTEYHNVSSAFIKVNSTYKIYSYSPGRENKFISGYQVSTGRSMVNEVRVSASENAINIGDIVIFNDDIVIVPTSDMALIQVGKRNYRGWLRIKVTQKGKITLVNIIDMESYLPGVVSSEMDEGWPEISLSAQAIAARSFAFFRIKNRASRKQGGGADGFRDYDLTDDVFSQVYKGEERTGPKTRQAVENTRGVILSYDAIIFNSLFSSTCGGHTEPGELVFGLTPITPLRGRPCGFCFHSKRSNWQVRFSEDEIIKSLGLSGGGA
ncbi:MAG: SpoIID/LytB domain-containing protein, partial [Planctomycetota bacterium]|nr:SpoIID/LytB domain-containing protein [Planctomycetota bacterium]